MLSPEGGIDLKPLLSEKDQILTIQQQFQTPQIAQAIAKKVGIELAVVQRSCEDGEPTGDFYRLIEHDGRLFILFGDAPKHGVTAASIVNNIHKAITPSMEQDLVEASRAEGRRDIYQSLLLLDAYLRSHRKPIGLIDDEDFGIPMLMVEIDRLEQRIQFANAGVTTEAILLKNNRSARLLTPNGFPLGALAGPYIDPSVEEAYASGDILILLTDGTDRDADAVEGERPIEKIKKFLQSTEAATLTPQQLVDQISAFIRKTADDLTIMAIQL